MLLFISSSPLFPSQKKIYGHTHLSGDWFGLRSDISESGLDFEIVNKNDLLFLNAINSTTKFFDLQNLDIDLIFNLDKLIGFTDAIFLFDAQLINGKLPNSDYIHSSQGISNIEADNNFLIYECFLTKKLFGNLLNIKFGLIDFNTEFDIKESGLNFITPSHGIGTDFALSGKNGPSIFPVTSLAFLVNASVSLNSSIKIGFFDGIPGDTSNPKGTHILLNDSDGLLVTGEFEYRIENGDLSGSKHIFTAGAWGITKSMLMKVNGFNSYGFYLTSNYSLFSEGDDNTQGLTGYIRLGYVNAEDNPTDFFLATALQYKGLFPGRDNDFVGLGLTWSSASDKHNSQMNNNPDFTGFDSNIELYYKAEIFGFLNIQPIVQYFINPFLSQNIQNNYVLAIRTSVMI